MLGSESQSYQIWNICLSTSYFRHAILPSMECTSPQVQTQAPVALFTWKSTQQSSARGNESTNWSCGYAKIRHHGIVSFRSEATRCERVHQQDAKVSFTLLLLIHFFFLFYLYFLNPKLLQGFSIYTLPSYLFTSGSFCLLSQFSYQFIIYFHHIIVDKPRLCKI